MNRKQAADRIGKSEKTISRAVAAGKLKAERKDNGELEIQEEELLRYDEESRALQPVQPRGQEEGETGQDREALVRVPPVSPRLPSPSLTLETLALAVIAIGQNLETQYDGTGRDKGSVSIADKLLLTLQEASALSNLSPDRLRKGIADGHLRAKKEGRGWKMRRVDLEAFVDELFGEK